MKSSIRVVVGAFAMASVASHAALSHDNSGFACTEGFGDVATLVQRGWSIQNNGAPLGPTDWFQGDPNTFPAFLGSPDSYVSADSNSASGMFPVISDWLICPEIVFGPNQYSSHLFRFYTRAAAGGINRLVVRLCTEDDASTCAAPGPESGDLGGFQTTLLDINADQVPGGYPSVWTEFALTAADGLPVVGHGRIAFHYYTFAPGGSASVIGIDEVAMNGASACPFTEMIYIDGFD